MTTNIVEKWTLREWVKMYGGNYTRAEFQNEDGDKFHTLVWRGEDGANIFVNFSKNLGELNNQKMRELKNELSVYKVVKESGEEGYSLGKTGTINGVEESLDF